MFCQFSCTLEGFHEHISHDKTTVMLAKFLNIDENDKKIYWTRKYIIFNTNIMIHNPQRCISYHLAFQNIPSCIPLLGIIMLKLIPTIFFKTLATKKIY